MTTSREISDRIDDAIDCVARYVEAVFPWADRDIESRRQAAAGLLVAILLVPFIAAACAGWWLGVFWRCVVMGERRP